MPMERFFFFITNKYDYVVNFPLTYTSEWCFCSYDIYQRAIFLQGCSFLRHHCFDAQYLFLQNVVLADHSVTWIIYCVYFGF